MYWLMYSSQHSVVSSSGLGKYFVHEMW